MLREMVRSLGVGAVFAAESGREALGILEDASSAVNVVICDWMMPQMTGIELLAEVRRRYPKTPFLMLTGKVDPEAVKQAVQGGVSGYIAKPVSRAQIEVKLRIIGQKAMLTGANA
jgi:two-component system chemotaxis response regulator CheY